MSYDTEYLTFRDSGVTPSVARDNGRATNTPVPASNTGGEMCISWHILGFCWGNCSRINDHRQQAAEEKRKLTEWCQACYRPASS